MWILNWLPDWLFYLMFFAGIVALIVGKILVPFRLYAYPAGVFLIIMGTWYSGGIAKDKEWKAKVAEVEAKLALAEVKSAVVNEKIITKVITKNQIIKLRGDDIVKYIDKEVIKYDNTCKIPLEVITVHNMAAKHD